ncbi:MAG: right-handed parallel beta-helix repeat-containing protein [Pseudothermotoga sp.]
MKRVFQILVVFALTLFAVGIFAQTNMKILDIGQLSDENITTNKQIADFLIAATMEKNVTVEPHSKTATDGRTFTKRLKLNGAGNARERSIHFTASANDILVVYAMSSSSSEDRKLVLYKSDGTAVAEIIAYGANLERAVVKIPEDGTYYLASPNKGVNIYYISVGQEQEQKAQRPSWDQVIAPVILSVALDPQDCSKVVLTFEMVIGEEGADKAEVQMKDRDGNVVESILIGAAEEKTRTVIFSPQKSGTYSFQVLAMRNDETTIKESNIVEMSFLLPLAKPTIEAYTQKNGDLLVEWIGVKEAEGYRVEYKKIHEDEFKVAVEKTSECSFLIPTLEVGNEYLVKVVAIRGDEEASAQINKVISSEPERKWKFIWFGQSTSALTNTCQVLEGGRVIKLTSATYKPDGTIDKKGGKFTSFFDGIYFYYTEVDPKKENFVLTATFHVDYLNPTPDGQEGFGILMRDSLGVHGSTELFMTNSAAILATKMEKIFPDGTKITLKDALGTRFTYGLTKEHIEKNTTAGATVQYSAFSWSPDSLIKQGESYTLTLKKTNTGYHAILNNDPSTEIIMYDNYWKKLMVLDPEKIYVGFAVARGCNVTITNISFTTSDPEKDPPAQPEPPKAIEPNYQILSPLKTGNSDYTFIFRSNADGWISIVDSTGNVVLDSEFVKASVDFKSKLRVSLGDNKFTVKFKPDPKYKTKDGAPLSSYETSEKTFVVNHRVFETPDNVIHVSPDGRPDNLGTTDSPVDIYTAVSYVKPGQKILLMPGTYKMTNPLIISKGIDGTEGAPITMTTTTGRAVLNFAKAGGGKLAAAFELWADYWHVSCIDVCNSDGNVKGIVIAGNHNILERVNAYNNGDTGIQISSLSTEPREYWPKHNLVVSCVSFNNCDPAANNADGFAAKLTVGEGNLFRNCIAYNNVDDGWDLYSKVETGEIGIVVIESCVAFKNGVTLSGRTGEGNGFKLGGEGIPTQHVLRNSVAFLNFGAGVTSNSNPAVIVERTTSALNTKSNYAFYGRGDAPRTFQVKGVVSFKGGEADIVELESLKQDPTNYFDDRNMNGEQVLESWFENLNTEVVPAIKEDGSIDMHGLLILTVEKDTGARF